MYILYTLSLLTGYHSAWPRWGILNSVIQDSWMVSVSTGLVSYCVCVSFTSLCEFNNEALNSQPFWLRPPPSREKPAHAPDIIIHNSASLSKSTSLSTWFTNLPATFRRLFHDWICDLRSVLVGPGPMYLIFEDQLGKKEVMATKYFK